MFYLLTKLSHSALSDKQKRYKMRHDTMASSLMSNFSPKRGLFATFAPMTKKRFPKTNAYKEQNAQFLATLRTEEGIETLSHGILYRVLQSGNGEGEVKPRSVVTIHYRGTLINGREFDNSRKSNCPAAFRVNELINGFQLALLRMHIGDRWQVFIPSDEGYGDRAMGNIPGGSTLIFDIELISIA